MNTNRVIALALGLLTAGVLALGWLLGVAPKLAEASRADDERVVVEAQNAAYQTMLADLADQYDNIDDLRAELDELHEFLPDHHGLEDFLDSLDAKAVAAGVVVSLVTMGEPQVAVSNPERAPGSGPTLVDIPVTVQVEGSLDATLAFVDAAQRADRVFVVTSVGFDAATSAATLTGSVYAVAELEAPPAG